MPKLIHITDLYHPHEDPDDHFDLAQIFALAKNGDIDLCHIIIDWPAKEKQGDPALCAVAQLNHLAGLDVPVTIGADVDKFRGKPELWANASYSDVKAADRIIEILKNSDEKVYITIVGGCLDTAIALSRNAQVFREKCAGILLNAGSATNTETLEYNVNLGRIEYSTIFSAPCPIYWSPCFDNIETGEGCYKTHWCFQMKEVFSVISNGLNSYFTYMLTESANPKYLGVLFETCDLNVLAEWGKQIRNMWCTGSIFHAGGLTVTPEGDIVSERSESASVYSYEPIRVSCNENGITSWEHLPESESLADKTSKRYIFKINDEKQYPLAMKKAMAEILKRL